MKYGVLGTGMVGQEIATKLASLGNEVCMGSRSRDNKDAKTWLDRVGKRGRIGTFAEAAQFGEVVVNCTKGAHSLEVCNPSIRKILAERFSLMSGRCVAGEGSGLAAVSPNFG